MASGSVSAGDAAKQSPQGRHHRTGGGEFWTPAVRAGIAAAPHASRHAKPMVAPAARVEAPTWPPAFGQLPPMEDTGPDPLIDTGPMGLHKFDLGYIPASVTPPRSWRRAAWFTVFCSAAALVGLMFVTSELVGPVHVASDINSLPGLPTDLPFYTPPSSDGTSPAVRHGQPPSRPGQPSQRPGQPGSAAQPTDARGRPIVTGGPDGTSDTQPSGTSTAGNGPSTVVTSPSTVTTVNTGPPAVDPGKLGTRTEQFFHEVTNNVDAAAGMTSDTVRGDAKAIIEQNYGDLSTIQIKSVSVDPGNGLTVSVLQVTNKDGSVSTEQRTLQFTLSGDPKIENPGG
ncbi:MAG TPA: hypothetical protein VJ914_13465 [Pseudonocardiaceae bacterium]|nr:hypothetical protein [Pseudonocardiaceae bacterium]